MTDFTELVKLLTAMVSLLTALVVLSKALKQGSKPKDDMRKPLGAASPAAQLLSAGSGCHNGL
ncbi:MAG: hypothetical protein UGF44_04030 [Collinsella sp.]|nr:hypothetical protein [Collinsella sp.]